LFSALHFLSPEDSQLYRLTRFSGATSSDRLIYWKMGVQGWLDYPVLGSGPENYFIAGEKYYEPELYLGEGNWPDKPHNYYVEVLSTTGIIGSAFYLVFIGLLYWSIINTRRKRVISEKVAMLCFGGLTAYLVSLLFLFEMFSFYHPFFLLVAVIASWGAGGKEGKPEGSIKGALGVVCCSAAIPILFLSQFLVPTGFLYYQAGQANHLIEEDVHQAHEIVQKISQLSFVHSYDPLVDTYVTLMQSAFVLGESYAFGEQVSQEAVTVAQLSAERAGNNASLWEKLASVYFLRATILRIEVEEAGFAAAQKSYDIAPKKIGSSILLINMYRNNRQIEEAVSLLEQVLEIAPTDPEVLWAAASVYHALGDQEQAMDYAYRSFMRGVKTYDDNILEWLLNAFYERGEIHKMVDLYEAALVMDPDKVEVLPDLASSYVTIGEYEKAKETALKFLDYYPDEEASVNEFLRALEPYLNDE
jgi:tetratricopeptide (TPR) repeat protein